MFVDVPSLWDDLDITDGTPRSRVLSVPLSSPLPRWVWWRGDLSSVGELSWAQAV